MINLTNQPVNTPISFVTKGPIASVTIFKEDGTSVEGTVQELTPDLVKVSFTPISSGIYTLFNNGGNTIGFVEVVTRSLASYLKNLEDEALGSWQWDKTTGSLTMVRQDGTVMANFNVVDTLTVSSRERV